MIDVKTKIIGTVDLKMRPESIVGDGNGHVYFSLPREGTVVAVNARTLDVLGRWSVDPDKVPHSLAIDAKNHRLFVGCSNELADKSKDPRLVVLDTESGKSVAAVPMGRGHDAAAFDPVNKLVFTSNAEGTLTVIREDSPNQFAFLENVPTEKRARTMALDPKTHRIFLVTGEVDTSAKPIPAVVDGTFRVLVVSR